jgi:phosphoribosyl 1,2-cyclic phosphate phosphodiesterase
LVEWEGYTYVVDCGPDFRYQMLRANCSKIDGILFTHEHSDHVAGLDDIRPFVFRQGDIPIYAHEGVFRDLHQRFAYVFETENKYPGAPSVSEHIITNTAFSIGNIEVTPVNVMHHQLQVFGFRFKDFVYITDAKTIADSELEKLRNVEVLVVNALRHEQHQSHFNLEEALDFINKVKPKRAYLTHISHLLGFHDEVEQTLPENVFLAYDNLEINI